MYEEVKADLMKELADIKSVSLTTDLWNSRSRRSYMGFTAHYINNKFEFCSKVLATVYVPENSTALNLKIRIGNVIDEWGLAGKVSYIVTDNGANIVKVVNEIGIGHIPCFAHTLNIVVKISIEKSQFVSDLVKKCRDCVTFFKQSTTASSKLLEQCASVKSHSKKTLVQDVPTRWNSTVLMLDSLSILKDQVLAVLGVMQQSRLALNEKEWSVITSLISLLRPFLEVTQELCAQNYPSISKVLPVIRGLNKKLTAFTSDVSAITDLRKTLQQNLNQRYSDMEKYSAWTVSSLLDPRYII